GAGLVAVVEGLRDAGDRLTGLVSFSGNHKQIAGLQFTDGLTDRLTAVADLARVSCGSENRGANGGWIFAARIVVGDDHHIGEAFGDLAHLGALAAIAIAPAAEDDEQ